MWAAALVCFTCLIKPQAACKTTAIVKMAVFFMLLRFTGRIKEAMDGVILKSQSGQFKVGGNFGLGVKHAACQEIVIVKQLMFRLMQATGGIGSKHRWIGLEIKLTHSMLTAVGHWVCGL